MSKVRIVIVPGSGGGDVERSNWYGWLRSKLREVRKRARALRTFEFVIFYLNVKNQIVEK